jgi:hypothetical protein
MAQPLSAQPVPQTPSPGEMQGFELDCYPYTFSPLLLFAQADYFDKGYSNYCSVAQFFAPALEGVNMLENVLYDRKNMLYEDLLQHVISNRMLVPCCIDAHFTAMQVLSSNSALFYDPLSCHLKYVSGDSFLRLAGFLLLKCALGDSQHMQDNKAHYLGAESNPTRRMLYRFWEDIHQIDLSRVNVQFKSIRLDLDSYLLVNQRGDPQLMSTQLTGNTCYFQTFLFGVMCKVGRPALDRDCVLLQHADELAAATQSMALYLLKFFVQEDTRVMRPLTNSNFVIDFFRFKEAPYYSCFTGYLKYAHVEVPDYELQYRKTLAFFHNSRTLHSYSKFTLSGAMSSTPNSKTLMPVFGTDDAVWKLAQSNYYKYRACNLMFGFNTAIMMGLKSFCEFNSLRKNQLLGFYNQLQPIFGGCRASMLSHTYRDYYFMPQFEIGQQELVDVHHYGYLVDMCSLYPSGREPHDHAMIERVNTVLADFVYFSTQQRSDYDKILKSAEVKSRSFYKFFQSYFLGVRFFSNFLALGFSDINPKEKEINSLSQSVFYTTELMRAQEYRMEHEFEKECINQMARSTSRKYLARLEGEQSLGQKYSVSIAIGMGFTYSKYNTLMHFLNVMENYWQNPDLNSIQVFGKDIRALLVTCCQKIFFHENHPSGFYHYGVMHTDRGDLDLAVATSVGFIAPGVTREQRGGKNNLILTDRVYEYHYLREILAGVFSRVQKVRVKSDNSVLNLCLLSLMLDFGLYEEHAALLNLPILQRLQRLDDKRQLQVEVANSIHEFDRKNSTDSVTRIKMEGLLFEASYKFLVNKNFPVHSKENELIQQLNADPAYQQQLLLCKLNMSLCQINKSVEVDYYKVRLEVDGRHGEFRTIIPRNFSKATGDYLEEITKRYTFSERAGVIMYDELPLFDLNSPQPEIDLFRVRFDSMAGVHSMVKYVEIKNVFQSTSSSQQFMFFIADNCLMIETHESGPVMIRINKIAVEVATIFFNEAISFVPCFKYADSEDVILFASSHIKYFVDQGGQFCNDYYGMKHELIENIKSEETFVDLNDEHVFKQFKLSELLTESKTVVYFPDFLLQVPSRQELINLLDLAIHIRNVSFFILVLFYLRRCSVQLEYVAKERNGRDETTKITGPWLNAIKYVLNRAPNAHYESIFSKQFFDLNQHQGMPLAHFIDVLCENFTKYQRHVDGGQYQIVPTSKQKAFLRRIVCAEECFHFSEVGSGKTKVILPLLCQLFLSNNAEAHAHLARGGHAKNALVVLVPEHLVPDARAQVFRYCLNLNFREDYRIYDDIFALMHDEVQFVPSRLLHTGFPMKLIFITSFNQFKKALTNDKICSKVWQSRERILVVTDEVDDFLDRDKLVFNICSNKNNSFDRSTLELYFEVSRAAYTSQPPSQQVLDASGNPNYWRQLHEKLCAIHAEIQDASKSVNKAFGIFNEHTLRHCSTNIAHDVEGYKSLIARPYESVNRAMPGSYYSDVERTIFLTYVILNEDIAKYDELFQQERKFISFEYWSAHVSQLDFDELVYGQQRLSELVSLFPAIKEGLVRFLYEIILRRMEIRDKSRSVNSIDVVFNFDCIGFTGTPFIDNYPTYAYIRSRRVDEIPSMIDRSFYAYTSDALAQEQFQEYFSRFQGTNCNVLVEYVSSDFVKSAGSDELAILEQIFSREERSAVQSGAAESCFNVLVDLCGIFKRSTIHDVRDLVLRHFGPDKFHYVYHIDQADSHDRVLSVNSDNDVQYDEEFFKFLCKTYGAAASDRVFFFVDNRNVIGKDVPFQLLFQRQFARPLFTRSVVLAHDVDDFSKIWQAMGRSRTMNDTQFSIYMSGIASEHEAGVRNIRSQELTRQLYVRNCDHKMAGNLSSIYQTLISLYNLSKDSFYYSDSIVNTFLEKMTGTITGSVKMHADQLVRSILGSALSMASQMPARILAHILGDKFKRSAVHQVATLQPLTTPKLVHQVLLEIVQQKYEQRLPSGDEFDAIIRLLSGEQQSLMEISYTKQQQKQKQKQQNKNQDSDTMDVFARKHQLELTFHTDNYYQYTLTPAADLPKIVLALPIPVPIVCIAYALEDGSQRSIKVFPTLQFLYSHHIHADYISQEVSDAAHACSKAGFDTEGFCRRFVAQAAAWAPAVAQDSPPPSAGSWFGSGLFSSREAAASASTELAVGQSVILQNFVNAVHNNGLRGTVVSQGADGTWSVRIDPPQPSSGNVIKCRSDKIHVIGSSASAASEAPAASAVSEPLPQLKILINQVRQNPQYTLAALQEGVYVVGMKDQFNVHDLKQSPLRSCIRYIVDDMGFVLFDSAAESSKSVDSFGPYFIEQYILMEVLSKQEVAQNVLDYYVNHKRTLQESLCAYSEEQGKGFICWRFLMKDAAKGKACGSPVLRALARKKTATNPDPAPPTSLLRKAFGSLF